MPESYICSTILLRDQNHEVVNPIHTPLSLKDKSFFTLRDSQHWPITAVFVNISRFSVLIEGDFYSNLMAAALGEVSVPLGLSAYKSYSGV